MYFSKFSCLGHGVHERQAASVSQLVALRSMVSGDMPKNGLLLQMIMTSPKEEQAKALCPLGQRQPFEREKGTNFTM